MAARKKRKPKAAPKRAQRSLLASRPSLRRPNLEAHHLDIIGLGPDRRGRLPGRRGLPRTGAAAPSARGRSATRGSCFGALGYAVPVALVAGGALVLARELRPPARPMRTGVLCLVAALTLMLAAGTLGLGPGA